MKKLYLFLFLIIIKSSADAQSTVDVVVSSTFKINRTEEFVSQSAPNSIPRVDLASIFKMPIESRGLEFRDTVRQLDNQTVQMIGFIVKSDEPTQGYFLLSLRPINLNEHADGEANDLPPATVYVMLAPSQSQSVVPYAQGPHTFQGVLSLGRLEHSDKSISWIRLQLPVIYNQLN